MRDFLSVTFKKKTILNTMNWFKNKHFFIVSRRVALATWTNQSSSIDQFC